VKIFATEAIPVRIPRKGPLTSPAGHEGCCHALGRTEIPACAGGLLEFNPAVLDSANRTMRDPIDSIHGQYRTPTRAGLGADVTAREITGEHG